MMFQKKLANLIKKVSEVLELERIISIFTLFDIISDIRRILSEEESADSFVIVIANNDYRFMTEDYFDLFWTISGKEKAYKLSYVRSERVWIQTQIKEQA